MKAFKVTGKINKPRLKTPFVKEVLADKSEHAVEKVYAEIGSKHRVKRCHIKIIDVLEVSADQIENPVLKKIVAEQQEMYDVTQADKSEEELRKLSVEMRYLEQTAETLQQRIGMVNTAISDLTFASMTLDGIETEKENLHWMKSVL